MGENCLRIWGALGVLAGLLTTHAHAQGVVWFDNRPAFLPSPPDRRVGIGGYPIGGNGASFYAQLWYQNNTGTWVAHPQIARFFTSAANAGYWNGGSRTLVNAGSPAPGQTRSVQMQVAVWDGGCGGTATVPTLTYDQARALGRYWGTSQIFTYTEEWDIPRGTDDTYMKNFAGFTTLSAPSPRCDCLAGAGAEFRFHVQAYSTSREVVLETRTNLTTAPWVPVRTNSGSFWFTNTASPPDSQRYYRARSRSPFF